MANAFRADLATDAALQLLQRELVLTRLFWRLGAADFAGKLNDTMTVRVPAVLSAREYEWRTRTAPIVVDDLTETAISVRLNRHFYSAVAVTDEELTLDVRDFTAQVLEPQVRAVAEKMETEAAASLAAVPLVAGQITTLAAAGGDPYDLAVEARRILNVNKVPLADRYLVMGTGVEASFLKSDRLSDAGLSGEAIVGSALRDATIGSMAGFRNLVVSQFLPAGTGYFFHRSAMAVANAAPAVPGGVTRGASRASEGLAMRTIQDYDTAYLRDRSVVSTFAGFSSVNEAIGDDQDGDTTADDPVNVRVVKFTLT